MWTVAIPRPLYARLAGLLDDARLLEGGRCLTADWQGRGGAAGGGRLAVRGMVRPGPESWNARCEDVVDPSSRYTHAAMTEADRAGRCLLFAHSHPSGDHPPGFSRADEAANARFFRDASRALGGRPLASIVRGEGGMEAAVGHEGKIHRAARVDIVGRVLERHGGGGGGAPQPTTPPLPAPGILEILDAQAHVPEVVPQVSKAPFKLPEQPYAKVVVARPANLVKGRPCRRYVVLCVVPAAGRNALHPLDDEADLVLFHCRQMFPAHAESLFLGAC